MHRTPIRIASPIKRSNPGFVGGGRTVGGAKEYVIPNGKVSERANKMKKIDTWETELKGQIIFDGEVVRKDEVCKRINWLRNNYLKEIAVDESGWEVLYQDPDDNRYWELTFPDSEAHGGGAPKLSHIVLSEPVKSKYNI